MEKYTIPRTDRPRRTSTVQISLAPLWVRLFVVSGLGTHEEVPYIRFASSMSAGT
jgi:hypothetical protein